LRHVPRHDFDRLAKEHHAGAPLRSIDRWSQFAALATAHLACRHSLRDVVANLAAQSPRLYHLGVRPVARSSLSRVNAEQPYTLYEALFAELYQRCRRLAPRHGFRFKNKLYSLDSSLIDLSLAVFPWAHYALGKAAMKLHVGLDHDGFLPAFAAVTESKVNDLAYARSLRLARGSIVVFDKGYSDYAWLKALDDAGVFFVTRARANIDATAVEERTPPRGSGVTSDRSVRLDGKRPQVELFFKWLKQNLKMRGFLGTTRNAVLTQIWVALCIALLLAYLKFVTRIDLGTQAILRLLQLNLFVRRDLFELLNKPPTDPPQPPRQWSLAL
jgi:putative transposase